MLGEAGMDGDKGVGLMGKNAVLLAVHWQVSQVRAVVARCENCTSYEDIRPLSHCSDGDFCKHERAVQYGRSGWQVAEFAIYIRTPSNSHDIEVASLPSARWSRGYASRAWQSPDLG
jgi:hypothetical protein